MLMQFLELELMEIKHQEQVEMVVFQSQLVVLSQLQVLKHW